MDHSLMTVPFLYAAFVGSANAPEQDDPDPAAQPKQWVPVMMDRCINWSNLIPLRWFGEP